MLLANALTLLVMAAALTAGVAIVHPRIKKFIFGEPHPQRMPWSHVADLTRRPKAVPVSTYPAQRFNRRAS